MTFSPIFSQYIPFVTESFCAPSASIGPLAMATLYNNLEWASHFQNSQQISNIVVGLIPGADSTEKIDYRTMISTSQVGKDILIHTFGPFKLNFDKTGQVIPVQIAFVPAAGVVNASTMVGNFKFALRAFGQPLGFTFPGNTGSLNSFNALQTATPIVGGYYSNVNWFTVTSAAKYGTTSSVIWTGLAQTKAYLPVTTSRPGMIAGEVEPQHMLDLNQFAFCYLDFYYRPTSMSANTTGSAGIKGLWIREYNPITALPA